MRKLDDTARLLRRIEALEKLLVCHRIGKCPSEALFRELDRTRAWTEQIISDRKAAE